MKNPNEWDEDYLLNLPVGEFDWLEIKGRRGLDLTIPTVKEADVKANLSKALSAFANSGGGYLVFGVANPEKEWMIDDGGVDLKVKSPNTREWLEDVIPNLVDYPLTDFNVYVIQSSGISSQISNGRAVYVIDIKDSERAPHQASDNKYYIRVGGKSKPVGHRIVTDIIGRQKHPHIQLEFQINSILYSEREIIQYPLEFQRPKKPKKLKMELSIRAINTGKKLAKYVNCIISVPKKMIPKDELNYRYKDPDDFFMVNGLQYVQWSRTNTKRDVLGFNEFGPSQYGPSWFSPILPSLSFSWEWDINNELVLSQNGELKIIWEVFADNAPPEQGEILIKDINIVRIDQ